MMNWEYDLFVSKPINENNFFFLNVYRKPTYLKLFF